MRKGLSILLAAMLALASAQAQTTISTFPYFHEFGYQYDGLEGWTTASQSDNEESTAWQEYYASLYSVSYYEDYYEGTYEVAMGEPAEAPMATDQYEVLNEIPEGYTLIGVLPNITDGYDNFMIYRNPTGAKKGAIGYE